VDLQPNDAFFLLLSYYFVFANGAVFKYYTHGLSRSIINSRSCERLPAVKAGDVSLYKPRLSETFSLWGGTSEQIGGSFVYHSKTSR
jgi:hypothetical protein